MRKPILQEYDLSQNDLEEYDKQLDNYRKTNYSLIERVNHCFKIALIAIAVITVFIVIILLIFKIEATPIIITFCACFCFEGILGVIANYYYAHTSDWLYKNHRLYNQIVNLELEKKILKYNNDLQSYEQEKRRISKEFWLNLTGYQFEDEVAKLYKKMGYNVKVTPKAADGGVDIILTKGTERIAVQCKHHKNAVGPNDVRALQGVVYNGDYTSGIFVSINGFTPTVPNEVNASKKKIELISLNDLLKMQESLSL